MWTMLRYRAWHRVRVSSVSLPIRLSGGFILLCKGEGSVLKVSHPELQASRESLVLAKCQGGSPRAVPGMTVCCLPRAVRREAMSHCFSDMLSQSSNRHLHCRRLFKDMYSREKEVTPTLRHHKHFLLISVQFQLSG